jgi:predicted permease
MGSLRNLLGDLALAVRLVRRNAALSIAAVLCFALGIGANTSIFSIVNGVLYRPLPFENASRLVLVSQGFSGQTADFGRVNAADYVDFRASEGRGLAAVALVESRRPLLMDGADPEPVAGAALTPSAFGVLGVRPAAGRAFVDADVEAGAPLVVILSDALWRRRYGADPGIVGRSIGLYPAGRTAEVVGVMPAGFMFPVPGLGADVGEMFLPLRITNDLIGARAERYDWFMIGRLSDGATIDQAKRALTDIASRFPERYPDTYGRMPPSLGELLVNVAPLREAAVGSTRRPLLLLLGAVGFVLLIACSNVAGLVIARAMDRRREITIRRALGASRARLWQQFFAETLVLVGLGAAVGVWIASWGGNALAAAAPGEFYRSFDVTLDVRVLGFTLAVTTSVALLFSLLPTLHTARTDVQQDLRDDSYSSTGVRAKQRALRALVIAETALAMMLTVGAGLLVRSFEKVHAADPGFDADRLMTFGVNFLPSQYPDAGQLARAQDELAARVRAIPGVLAASGTTHFPLSGLWRITFTTEDDPAQTQLAATNARVLPEFFEAMRIPVLAGRTFTARDAAGAPAVAVISETLARQQYGTTEVVGRRIIWGDPASASSRVTIIGVVADVRQQRLDEAPQASVYMPRLQDETGVWGFTRYVVRTGLPAASMIPQIRGAIRDYDPGLLALEFADVSDIAAGTISDRRFNTLLFQLFAALALLLAATGLYGLMQYSVARRTRELGIRVALGARSPDIMRLMLGEGVRLMSAGIAVGLCGAILLTRFMQSLLFETSPLDVMAFAGSALVLLVVALLSAYLPARRALRLHPVVTLRTP